MINLLVAGLVIVMAYAVAFFGVSWPDRVVKSRLFKWIMRGPVTASVALALMTIVRRAGLFFGGSPIFAFVPLTMVATVLLFEHAITLFAPIWERYLFFGRDRAELQLLPKYRRAPADQQRPAAIPGGGAGGGARPSAIAVGIRCRAG